MKIKFYTLGCKVNQYETQAMREEFMKYGFSETDGIPDVAVINSCSVTAESDRKTRQLLNRIKREYPLSKAVLTGCMVEAYPDASRILNADLIIGNKSVKDVVDKTIEMISSDKTRFFYEPHEKGEIYNTLPITRFEGRTRAFMKIEDGCDRFCSYCIIPYARGSVRSRALESIKSEAEALSKNGFCEIVLVGINLSAYGKGEDFNLCDAVDTVCGVDGIKRVRLGSLEPDHITDEMLKRFKAQEKFCPQFHLSLQSGADNTLKRMNRHYDSAFYFDLISRIRNVFDNAAITTDVMVGFTDETDNDFLESLSFVKKAKFARAHVFSYSNRNGTAASRLGDTVTPIKKAERSKQMIKVAKQSEAEFLKNMVGQTVSVLFEKNNEGYTKNYSRVVLSDGKANLGEIKKVKIIDSSQEYCMGILVK